MEVGQGWGWPGLSGKVVSLTLKGHAGYWACRVGLALVSSDPGARYP